MTETSSAALDLAEVKARQRTMWGTANYASVGSRILLVSELLCEAVDLRAGDRVLDVACGTGNTALAAARRFAHVVGCDFQPRLLELARQRADIEQLDVELREADAEDLPFADETFDAVLSTCGAMFAPDHGATASELLRVCAPGGRIGMVNWTPSSWVAELGRTLGRHAPPPPGLAPPVSWGDEAHVAELFGDAVDLATTTRTFLFRFRSVDDHVDHFARDYPPIAVALERLDDGAGAQLRADIAELARRFDVSTGDDLTLPLEYLEVVARKR